MVGKKCYKLEEILNEKQLHHVVKEAIGEDKWQLISFDGRQAVEGLAGFLGDHMRMTLRVEVDGSVRTMHLFAKRVPVGNKPKADFIDDNHYFRRERMMFQLFKELRGADGAHPWSTKAYISTDYLLVMPDLVTEGYRTLTLLDTFDLPHVMITAASIARFHAAFANFETRRTVDINRPYTILQEYGHLMTEPTFFDSPWLRACAKLTKNLLNEFSNKYNSSNVTDLEDKLAQQYILSCDMLQEYEDTLNVMIHKDLWTNNIMFKYENGVPNNAILIDYQCIRYGPPAFDLMVFLYLTTSRSFRQQFEKEVMRHYFSIFYENIDDATKARLNKLGYDEQEYFKWCEKSRIFGAFEALGIFPFTMMDPKTAEETFDNPETYEKHIHEDRTVPVIEYCRNCRAYRDRQLELSEEFVERYVLNM